MATYFTDFSDTATGSVPSAWTVNDAGWEVQSNTDYTNDRAFVDTSDSAGEHAGWEGLGQSSDQEIVFRVRTNESSSYLAEKFKSNLRIIEVPFEGGTGRYHAGVGTTGGVTTDYISKNNDVNLSDAGGSSFSANTWFWVRFRANGTNLKLRVWKDGTDEPSTWTLTATDSEHSSGYVGLTGSTETSVCEFDVVGVGTNGDTAPKEGATAPAAPTNLSLSLQ